jgi:hypothetical protein
MKHLYVPSQDRLKYAYENGQARVQHNPEYSEKYLKRLQQLPVYTNEEDAVKAFWELKEQNGGNTVVWAKIEVDEEYFYLREDHLLVTDDGLMHQAADYLGLIDTVPKQ